MYSIVIPLEQGLRHQRSLYLQNSAVHSIVIPLEQGLRPSLGNQFRTQSLYSIVIPLEQGLRPYIMVSCIIKYLFYCHSIRTRIKTLKGA